VKIKAILGASILLFGCVSVQAAIVQVADHPTIDNLVATGIIDLEVGGNYFDVDFELGTFNALNTGQNFPWIGNETQATAARNLINDLLTDNELISAVGEAGTIGQNGYWLPYEVSATLQYSVVGTYAHQAFQPGTGSARFDEEVTFAIFTPSPIPVPAAVWLFGTGILGLIGFSKRRKAH